MVVFVLPKYYNKSKHLMKTIKNVILYNYKRILWKVFNMNEICIRNSIKYIYVGLLLSLSAVTNGHNNAFTVKQCTYKLSYVKLFQNEFP